MRRSLMGIALVALFTACADEPLSPTLLSPGEARFFEVDNPPPPWAVIGGEIESNTATYTYVAHFFVNKPGNVAWVSFQNGGTAQFSPNARLMVANGKVIGVGTMTLGANIYQLSSTRSFSADRNCMSSTGPVRVGPSCATFGGEGFSSSYSFWTGGMANDGRLNGGPPFDDCTKYCVITTDAAITKTNGR